MVATADALAGIDPERYKTYMYQVNDFEDRWRDVLVPKIMRYQRLGTDDYASVPEYRYQARPEATPWLRETLKLFYMTGMLVFLVFLLRSRIAIP